MAVAIYARVSTEEQRERQSIRTQIEFAERYCKLHDLAVHRIYSDDGVSGTVPLDKRREGRQILQDARLGKFNQLLVYKLDRLGRETRLILNAVDDLEKSAVRIRSMTEEFDTGSATGRLMLTMLSGFASHEREVIRERSVAGTLRVAESGAWMGGIVPYGYRKVGEKRSASIVVSEDPIPGASMSEADVIREVFRMAAVEKKSCRVIARRLNDLRIPCAYVRDDRLLLRGKRKQRTSGVWRPGRVRGLITNRTYMGIHEFGKRTKTGRPVISRPVPAIVSEEIWRKAQETLKANFLFCARSAKNQYLLRGLIKCGLCGRTYIGVAANRPNGRREFYYRCNGAHSTSVFLPGERCGSKAVRGDDLEQQVWSDVETFLRNPDGVLADLQARLESQSRGSDRVREQIAALESLFAEKGTERTRVLALYRRGRLTDTELDAQLDEIGDEEAGLEAQLAELRASVTSAGAIESSISSAQELLRMLRKRLDQPVSWELKRKLVEVIVAGVRVDTVEEDGVKQAKITVTYRFNEPGQALPLVLPQNYSAGRAIRIPTEPKTIGDHIRRRRLVLKLIQKDVAKQVGVDKISIHNWETNMSSPRVRYMPAIIQFLGYNPLPPTQARADRLIQARTALGLSQENAARQLGVDPSTLARWERRERKPTGAFAARAAQFVSAAEMAVSPAVGTA